MIYNVLYRLSIKATKRKTFGARSIAVAGAELWNKLPNDIKSIANFMTFKRKLKTYLFYQAYN